MDPEKAENLSSIPPSVMDEEEKARKRREQNSIAAKRHREKQRRLMDDLRTTNDQLRTEHARNEVYISRLRNAIIDASLPVPDEAKIDSVAEGVMIAKQSAAESEAAAAEAEQTTISKEDLKELESRLMKNIAEVQDRLLQQLVPQMNTVQHLVEHALFARGLSTAEVTEESAPAATPVSGGEETESNKKRKKVAAKQFGKEKKSALSPDA